MVYSKCKLEQKGRFGNGYTKVPVKYIGYFERKVNEANSEGELRDHSGKLDATACNKSCQVEGTELWGQTEHKLNAVLPVPDDMTTGSDQISLSHHQFLHPKENPHKR